MAKDDSGDPGPVVIRSRDGGIVGEATLDFISQFRLDFGILGISGIDTDWHIPAGI